MKLNTLTTTDSLGDQIRTALLKIHVPFESLWGIKPGTNTLNHFIQDVQNHNIVWDHEKATDTYIEDLVTVRIQCRKDGKIFELNGRTKYKKGAHRQHEHKDITLSKVMTDQTPYGTLIQGLYDEFVPAVPKQADSLIGFGNPNQLTISVPKTIIHDPRPSVLYPPLKVIFHERTFRCEIPENMFRAKYRQENENRISYYVWIEVKT